MKRANELYIGLTHDLRKRLKEHNAGFVSSTKRYMPWRLIYYEAFSDQSIARTRERRLKNNGNAMLELKKRIHTSGRKSGKGFSLIELMVSVALFSVVMLVSVGSVMALVNANRKAQALQSVMNNLNIAIDGMVRTIRMGSVYHCGDVGDYSLVLSCENGDTFIAFEPFGGSESTLTDQWLYWYNATTKRLYKSEDGGATQFALTAPEIQIEDAKFYVVGAERTDTIQPKVVIVIRGVAGSESAKVRTTFSVQSTAVQRQIDI